MSIGVPKLDSWYRLRNGKIVQCTHVYGGRAGNSVVGGRQYCALAGNDYGKPTEIMEEVSRPIPIDERPMSKEEILDTVLKEADDYAGSPHGEAMRRAWIILSGPHCADEKIWELHWK